MPMINEAVFALRAALPPPKLRVGNEARLPIKPMGPLALADVCGLITCLSIMEVSFDGLAIQKYRPWPL